MMRFSTLLRHPANWMVGDSTNHSAVITSRIRLARNLSDHSFPGWATKEERKQTLEVLCPVVENLQVMKNAFSRNLAKLDSLEKQVLVERHLISREHAARTEGSAAVIQREQNFSFMLNEEDHLRMQAIRSGLNLREAFHHLSEIDTELEKELNYAFDLKLGFLTTCPTNLGTGLRASAMLHLPGLVLSDQINQVLQAVNKIGLAVRGIYGEGTESLGHLYQISNQSTLGESEESIIETLERVIKQVASHEQNAREKLMEDDSNMVADKVGRAFGVLRHAYLIDSKESLNHLSLLRLGGSLGMFPEETLRVCDSLMMDIQQAHLQLHAGKKLSPERRDSIRAEILRTRLQTLESPDSLTTDKLQKDHPEEDDNSEKNHE